MQYVVDEIVKAAALFTAEGLAQAQLYAETAATIGDALKAGYESLVGDNGIYGYLGVGHEIIDLFLADMLYVVEKIVEAAASFTGPGLAGATALSNTMKAVGAALEAGVGGLIKPQTKEGITIADYAGIAHEIFDLFVADMVYVVGIVEAAAMEFREKGLVQAKQFAESGAAIFTAIEKGVKAAIATGGIGDTGGLGTAMGLITSSVVDAVTSITASFATLVTRAYHFGADWVSNIIAGMTSRLDDLEALLEYIRGLFPSSPAKYGAWRDLPDGRSVGAGFASGMTVGLLGGKDDLLGALGALRGAFAMTPVSGLVANDNLRSSRNGGGYITPPLTVNQTININGAGDPVLVRSAARLGILDAARAAGISYS